MNENVKKFINDEPFLLVTSHRRENILNKLSLKNIVDLINSSDKKVVFPMGYATQRQIKEFGLNLNDNVLVIDPIGYLEFIYLLKKSQYCISDSGTVIEEACILNIPSIQMRYSTERPEVYEVGSSIKFDPTLEVQKFQDIHLMVDSLKNNKWSHPFGDGTSSKVIVEDLIDLSTNNKFHMHNKEDYDFDISRSFLQ